jgi:ABC-type uncharacterized transport system permease subunit
MMLPWYVYYPLLLLNWCDGHRGKTTAILTVVLTVGIVCLTKC